MICTFTKQNMNIIIKIEIILTLFAFNHLVRVMEKPIYNFHIKIFFYLKYR